MDDYEQPFLLFPVLPKEKQRDLFDPDNASCPFCDYIGNRHAVEELLEIAAHAFKMGEGEGVGQIEGVRITERVSIGDVPRIRLQGPASSGKTTLVKHFAKLMELPYIETDGRQVRELNALMKLFEAACDEKQLDFEPVRTKGDIDVYEAPPMIFFIDEVHLAAGNIQDSLLKATESDDGLLILDGVEIDCRNVYFIIGTTDGGKLRPAFKTRFQLIRLNRHTENQVSEIVQRRFPEMDKEVCNKIADLKPIPREAINLARRVLRIAQTKVIIPEKALAIIVKRDKLMSDGMSEIGIKALTLMAAEKNGLSMKNLCSSLEIDEEEWLNDIMPSMMGTEKHLPYVEVSHRHIITEAGRNFLKNLS